jgi:hypothetical protein
MSDLCCIVYVSTAYTIPTESELENLLAKARDFNKIMGVTGVLLHHDRMFFQYIEGACGDGAGLNAVYEKIKESKQHHNIIELFSEKIDRRLFGDWLMGSTQVSEQTLTTLQFANWKQLKHALFDKTKPETHGLLLLQFEWEQMMSLGIIS